MAKGRLSLTVDHELVELAKNSNINLSAEFEEWIRIRLNKHMEEDNEIVDYALERAKLQQQISLLASKEELAKNQEHKDKEELMILDGYVENILEFEPNGIKEDELIKRSHGLVFLFKSKLNKVISIDQAKELLRTKIKVNE